MAQAIEEAISALEKKSTTEPSNPVSPEGNPSVSGDSTKIPQTGDGSNMVLWFALLLLVSGCLGGTLVYSKNHKTRK